MPKAVTYPRASQYARRNQPVPAPLPANRQEASMSQRPKPKRKRDRRAAQLKCSDLSKIVDFDFIQCTQRKRRDDIITFMQYDIEMMQRRWLTYIEFLVRDYVEFNSLRLMGVIPNRFVNREQRWELAKIYEEKYRPERLKLR